jgi:hypothetical protein
MFIGDSQRLTEIAGPNRELIAAPSPTGHQLFPFDRLASP